MSVRGSGPWMSSVIARALEQGRRVEIVMDGGGLHLEIDGERLTDGSSGLPLESFEYPLRNRGVPNVSERALDLADRVMFTGDEPRCPQCYGPRMYFTTTSDGGRDVRLAHCQRCHVTVPVGERDE